MPPPNSSTRKPTHIKYYGRWIDIDLLDNIREELTAELRRQGLTGIDLDIAIMDQLPRRVRQVLNGSHVTI
jgi:hypothetical protein